MSHTTTSASQDARPQAGLPRANDGFATEEEDGRFGWVPVLREYLGEMWRWWASASVALGITRGVFLALDVVGLHSSLAWVAAGRG